MKERKGGGGNFSSRIGQGTRGTRKILCGANRSL